MKVVALHTDFRIYWPARLKALSTALAKRGDSLSVIEIAGKGSPYSFASSGNISEIDWRILFPESKPEQLNGKTIKRTLFNLLNELNPDVIVAGAIAFPSGALAVQWGQENDVPIIVFDDSKIDAVQRSGIINFIKQSVYSGVDAMLYPAEDWNPTGEFWSFKLDEIFYGVDVVDNDFWAESVTFDNPWGNYFMAVGRQIEKKNYFSIVDAYNRYVKIVGAPNAYNLVLIGEGPEHQRIANFVKQQGISRKVFLLPFLSQNELRGVYQNAKALCSSSSSSETWGLVINEAMSGGCPIFASYECGASNVLVKDGVNGYRFHCDDVNRLSKYMVEFHNLPPEEQIQMRESSRKIIANWNLDRFVQGCIEAIDHVTTHSKRKSGLVDKIIIKLWKGQYRPI